MASKNGSNKQSKKAKKNKAPGRAANALRSLTQRVKTLEGHVVGLKSFAAMGGPPPPGMRPMTFTLAAGGPHIVRLLLDGHESISLGSGTEPSLPRAKGVKVDVQLEVWGDPGQKASIAVTNAVDTPLESAVLTGSYLKEMQELETRW